MSKRLLLMHVGRIGGGEKVPLLVDPDLRRGKAVRLVPYVKVVRMQIVRLDRQLELDFLGHLEQCFQRRLDEYVVNDPSVTVSPFLIKYFIPVSIVMFCLQS